MEELARQEHESESADETANRCPARRDRPPSPSGALIAVGLLGVGNDLGRGVGARLRRRVGRT